MSSPPLTFGTCAPTLGFFVFGKISEFASLKFDFACETNAPKWQWIVPFEPRYALLFFYNLWVKGKKKKKKK